MSFNNGVLQLVPSGSGFWTTAEAIYVHHHEVPGSFLAVALTLPLDEEEVNWPDNSVNLAGLVVREGSCESATDCERRTKFEVGMGTGTPTPSWIFATSREGTNDPPLEADFEDGAITGVDADSCPPPILVGLCATRSGGNINFQGHYAVAGAPTSATTESQQGWAHGGANVDVGLVAASGFSDMRPGALPGDDIRARFGIFAIYPIQNMEECSSAFEAVRALLDPPGEASPTPL
jgi:hypothetical protein